MRTAAGKPPVGCVTLAARNQSGELLITVQDDGAGIDRQRILEKAIARHAIDQAEADRLDADSIINLIFLPGLSTKEQATDLSGRGVGMDVVRTNIEAIGGVIEASSDLGRGTRFTFRLPLAQSVVSSSLITAIVLQAGGQRFALPESSVNEIIRINPQDAEDHIALVDGRHVYQLRDKVLSIIHLEEALNLEPTFVHPTTGEILPDRRARIADRRQNEHPELSERFAEQRQRIDRRQHKQTLVVVEFRRSLFGLLIDRVEGVEEVVVRSSPALVDHVPVFGGHTVLGDGSLVMMCDIAGIVETMGLRFVEESRSHVDTRGALKTAQQMVVFDYSPEEYFAIPLMMTGLIERIQASDIKHIGSKEYYQLKDQTIPLLRLEDHLDITTNRDAESYHLILPARLPKPIGILAGMSLEVHDFSEAFDSHVEVGNGIIGTAYRDDHLIMLIDLYGLCEHAMPDQFSGHQTGFDGKARILLAEDNRFFAKLVTGYLDIPSVDLTVCGDGQEAWEVLQQDSSWDIVVSDIEMPRMNGFELVSRIRADARLRELPVIALTSLADEESRQRGIAAGFDDYAVKIDKNELLSLVEQRIDRLVIKEK